MIKIEGDLTKGDFSQRGLIPRWLIQSKIYFSVKVNQNTFKGDVDLLLEFNNCTLKVKYCYNVDVTNHYKGIKANVLGNLNRLLWGYAIIRPN